ncbi:MAG: cytochrome c [Nitrospirae bacterium]|nr:cytochrome c [Nitrospirota bacterium]
MKRFSAILGVVGFLGFITACGGGEGPIQPPKPVPAEYADKHMPEGWWTDPKIVEEGKKIYKGEHNIDVNCASCHGKDGKPVKRGARDFRTVERVSMYTDSYWFWRISEGVPNTKMKPWKEKLSEEERWKLVAYEHTFSHGGQPAMHDDYKPAAAAAEGPK